MLSSLEFTKGRNWHRGERETIQISLETQTSTHRHPIRWKSVESELCLGTAALEENKMKFNLKFTFHLEK